MSATKQTATTWVAIENEDQPGSFSIYDGACAIAHDIDAEHAPLISAAPELLKLAILAEQHLRYTFMQLAEKYAGTPWEKDAAYIKAEAEFRESQTILKKARGQS